MSSAASGGGGFGGFGGAGGAGGSAGGAGGGHAVATQAEETATLTQCQHRRRRRPDHQSSC